MRARSLRSPSIEWGIASVVITVAVVSAISIFLVGLDTLTRNLRMLSPAALGICILLMLWQLGCRFVRWFFYARCLGLEISLGEASLFYAGGLGMAITPGRAGELVRLWFVEKKFAVPYRRIAGLYVADRASDVYAYLLLLAIGAVGYGVNSAIAWGALVAVTAGTIAIMYPRPLLKALTAAYGVVHRWRKLLLWARRAIRNTSTLFQPSVLVPGLIVGAVGWAAAPAVLLVSLSQMGVRLDPVQAFAIYAAAALTGGSSMLPGGGGVTEAVLVSLLAASGVPFDSAITAMIVTRMAFLWMPVGLGILALPAAMRAVHADRPGVIRSAAVGR